MMNQPESPSRSRARIVWAVAAAALLLGAAGCQAEPAAPAAATTAASPAPKTITVWGKLKLGPGDFVWDNGFGQGTNGPWCAGSGGYDDIVTGASVTITDAAGAVVALGQVNSSNPTDFVSAATGGGGQRAKGCDFAFTVTNVPAGKGFYGIEVSHRGAVKFAEADLAETVNLTLG